MEYLSLICDIIPHKSRMLCQFHIENKLKLKFNNNIEWQVATKIIASTYNTYTPWRHFIGNTFQVGDNLVVNLWRWDTQPQAIERER